MKFALLMILCTVFVLLSWVGLLIWHLPTFAVGLLGWFLVLDHVAYRERQKTRLTPSATSDRLTS